MAEKIMRKEELEELKRIAELPPEAIKAGLAEFIEKGELWLKNKGVHIRILNHKKNHPRVHIRLEWRGEHSRRPSDTLGRISIEQYQKQNL